MRLIDADKVKRAFIGNRYGTKAIEYVIDDAPTVKAIPIEWLKLKIDTVLNIYPNGNEETEVLCKLLYDWEKENEIDKDTPRELLSEREKRALQEAVTWVTSWLGPDAVVGISYTEEDWEKEK